MNTVLMQALEEFRQERFREAVEREKQALREAAKAPWWKRLARRLPFTFSISIKRNT
jgi:hypothetical protein